MALRLPTSAHCGLQVTTVREATLWLSYTYLYTRMTQNPLAYGVGWEELAADPRLEGHRWAGGGGTCACMMRESGAGSLSGRECG
jgi:hypothetical protein